MVASETRHSVGEAATGFGHSDCREPSEGQATAWGASSSLMMNET